MKIILYAGLFILLFINNSCSSDSNSNDAYDSENNLEEEIIRKQNCINQETKKNADAHQKLENAENEILCLKDKISASEMDCKRLATNLQDEVDELLAEKNRLDTERTELENQL